jgi:hypothetical protein
VDEWESDDPGSRSYAQRWRTARIGWPSLIALLVVMAGVSLGAASGGGWGGVAVIVLITVGMLGLLYVWSAVPPNRES